MKVEIFYGNNTKKVQEDINEFIKNKEILDIKFQMSSYGYCNGIASYDCMDISVLVTYEDKE